MDIIAFAGGGTAPEGERKPAIEYTAQAVSSFVNGEVKLTIGENGLTAAALFDAAEIAFAEMNLIELADYVVTVRADSGDYTFSRMGGLCQPFYDALREAYNKAVLRALFVSGKSIASATGEYRYTEAVNGAAVSGSAPVYVYENSVVSLPPDLGARRVPLCFVSGMDKGDYELTLRLDTGERYTYAKLGYDTVPIEAAIEKQIRALREKSLAAVNEIDPTLTAAQASRIARLMPEGAAAPLGEIMAIAPSFVTAIEAAIADSRAVESYRVFKNVTDPQIYVGFRKNAGSINGAAGAIERLTGGLGDMLGGGNPLSALGGGTGGETEDPPATPYLFWLIAPSPDGRFAAVEFAEADSATFVYRTGGDFPDFAQRLNRALEAINFKREVIRLSDAEIQKPENADYYMANKRTEALQFVRANFAGRVIHSSAEAWERKLTELWGGSAPVL
jgi:hypothetical protein